LLHQVSHSNSKTTINADRRGNKGSRIVIEAIDKKLALLFVKQGGSSVSAALLNGVAFFFAGKGRVAALVPVVGCCLGAFLFAAVSPCFCNLSNSVFADCIYFFRIDL
jgi:hypothetical protein